MLHVQVRDGVVAVLDAWLTIAPPERAALALTEAISSNKATPDGRVTGLRWLAGLASGGKATAPCVDALQKAASASAQDRSAEVREAAGGLSTALSQQVGSGCFIACWCLSHAHGVSGESLQWCLQLLIVFLQSNLPGLVRKLILEIM